MVTKYWHMNALAVVLLVASTTKNNLTFLNHHILYLELRTQFSKYINLFYW